MDISCLSIAFVTCLCHLVFQSFSASKDVFGPINSFYFSVKLEEGMQVPFLSMIPAESSSLTLRLEPSGILDAPENGVMDASWHSMQLVSNTFLVDRQAGSFKSGKKFFIDTMQLSRRGGRSASCLLTPLDQFFSLWLVYVECDLGNCFPWHDSCRSRRRAAARAGRVERVAKVEKEVGNLRKAVATLGSRHLWRDSHTLALDWVVPLLA